MKKSSRSLFCLVCFVLLLGTLKAQKKIVLSNPAASMEAKALFAYINDMYGKKMLSGQMWASWGIDELKYIKEQTGKQPAIRGMDLINSRENEAEVQRAIDWWKNGGIPTIMWHWGAPSVGEGYENSKKPVSIDSIFIDGTPQNISFWKELKTKADLLVKIKDANVPILWRPFHELNGNWFWWGKQGPERFKKLWITVYNYLVNERKLNNLIWVLCYTGQPDPAWFPGKQYVDIAGADTYNVGASPQTNMFLKVKNIVGEQMPVTYHECGTPPNPDSCLKTGTLWSWWMEWHTGHLQKVDKNYLKYVYDHDLVITLDEVPDIIKTYGKGEPKKAVGKKETPATKFQIKSPAGEITLDIVTGQKTQWSARSGEQILIAPSAIALHLQNGDVLGQNVNIISARKTAINDNISALMYKKDTVRDHYNQLILSCRGNYSIEFRVYDDGLAYRFLTNRKDSLIVQSEKAEFTFDQDYSSLFPYANDPRDKKDLFQTSFEAFYQDRKLSQQLTGDSIAILPALIHLANGKKAVITEAHLENYPGMYLGRNGVSALSFNGQFAAYPASATLGGYNSINYLVTKRENFLARTAGTTSFPWRCVIIAPNDAALANSDMVYRLAAPLRVKDVSWIKGGKVAWDWWNNRNISGIDFKSGINTETYKYFIDFAAENKLEYVILDGGWSTAGSLFSVNRNLDLPLLISYGKQKGVGLILWASWSALMANIDTVMAHYSALGVKGFKIDFIDRDDQLATASTYSIAEKAAKHKLLIDLHGMFKPEGLNRTYPNVVNYEGVKGLENSKWGPVYDAPQYDVTIPFIRMLAGPMDYTPGALHNVSRQNFMPSNSAPMSQGTRCHQLAMYTVYEAPLQMLSDNPTDYRREKESTDFIAKVPTVFNETRVIDGKIGEHVAIARRKAEVWFVGVMTNWDARDLNLDLSFLTNGEYEAEIFMDGVNADKKPEDYKTIIRKVNSSTNLNIHLAPGGGWTARIYPAK